MRLTHSPKILGTAALFLTRMAFAQTANYDVRVELKDEIKPDAFQYKQTTEGPSPKPGLKYEIKSDVFQYKQTTDGPSPKAGLKFEIKPDVFQYQETADGPSPKPMLKFQVKPDEFQYQQNTDGPSPKPETKRVQVVQRFPAASGLAVGIEVSPVPPAMAAQLRLKSRGGAVVESVVSGSSAEQAGLQQYDVIEQVAGENVRNPEQLREIISNHKSGETVAFSIVREGKRSKVEVSIRNQPQAKPGPRPTPFRTTPPPANPFQFSPADKQKLDQMSDKLHRNLEDQQRQIEQMTERLKAQMDQVKDQIQQLKEQIKAQAQEQKKQAMEKIKEQADQFRFQDDRGQKQEF